MAKFIEKAKLTMEVDAESLYARAAVEHLVGALFYGLALLCDEVEPQINRFSSKGKAEQSVIEAALEFRRAESPSFPESMCVMVRIDRPAALSSNHVPLLLSPQE